MHFVPHFVDYALQKVAFDEVKDKVKEKVV